MDATELTVREAAQSLRAGDITAESYVDALLARTDANRDLNAFITLDRQRALAAACEADDKRARGADLGALHGVPLVLKDNIEIAGFPTTAGTPALRHHNSGRTAPVAQALVDAAAIVLGKTNMHELAFGITNNNQTFGATCNPYGTNMIPGGSSGGTGVAVAARLVPGGLGTDTGGSVRIRAALCGIVGFRPSMGRYSQQGIVPISHTRDTAGPMVRSVADAVLLDGVITGGATALEPTVLNGLRLGVARTPFFGDLDAALAAVIENELKRLRDLGVVLIEFDAPEIAELDHAAAFPITLYETVTTLTAYLESSGLDLGFRELCEATTSPDVNSILMSLCGDEAVPEAAYREAMEQQRPALQATIAAYLRDHQAAALILPTTPLPARPIGQDETVEVNGAQVPIFPAYIRNTGPASVAGLPGLSLPIGLTADGLRVGIELDGRAGGDHELLSLGLGYEATLEALPPPPI